MKKSLFGLVAAVGVLVSGFSSGWAAEKEAVFRAGAAKGVITPWLGVSIAGSMRPNYARNVHDELHARCVVLDDGTTRLAITIVDNCLIPREVFDSAKRMVKEKTGLPMEQMMMAATHTHSAPTVSPAFQNRPDPDYREWLIVRLADTVRRALNNLEPARIAWGVGEEGSQVFNRRWFMKPETELRSPLGRTDTVRMNPPAGHSTLVKPAGPTDPEVPVVSVQSADGRPLALLANYTLHYVGGTRGSEISADYFGMFADRIQEMIDADRLDPPFVGMLSNGASGDINNIDFRTRRERKQPYEQMRLVADTVAAEAFRVHRELEYSTPKLRSAQKEIRLGVRKPSAAELEEAKALIAGLRAKGRTDLKSREEIYAQETIELADYPDEVGIIVQVFRIGDLAIVALPTETFVEIGLEIKERSPFKPTFVIELANGYNGYLPTVKHHELGGYETWRAKSSYLEVQAAPKIVKAAIGLLESLK